MKLPTTISNSGDGATIHTANVPMVLLGGVFEDKIISEGTSASPVPRLILISVGANVNSFLLKEPPQHPKLERCHQRVHQQN